MATNTESNSLLLDTATRQTKVQRIGDYLRKKIQNGAYPPGSKLDAERSLTQRFKVNRATVNKVMALLAAERLIERHPGRGTFVAACEARAAAPSQPARTGRLAFVFYKPLRAFALSRFYSRLLDGVYGEALRCGYRLILEYASEVGRLIDGPVPEVDGLLAVSVEDEAAIARWRSSALPVVCCDYEDSLGACDSATLDQTAAARAIAEHLFSRGKRRIGLINEQLHPYRATQAARQREECLRVALARQGVTLHEECVLRIADRGPSGTQAIRTFLASPNRPEAVVLFHSLYEFPLVKAMAEVGLSCPRDLAVASFALEDEPAPGLPPMAGARFSAEALGSRATALLIRRLEQPASPIQRIRLAPDFLPGESV